MPSISIDFETRSRCNFKKAGIDRYACDPTTEILMMAYAFNGEPVEIWIPHLGPLPERVRAALVDPAYKKYAWNVNFEVNIVTQKLGLPIKIEEWYDPAAHARYLGYPPNLDEAGDVLGVDVAHEKSKDGKALIKLFCEPTKAKKPTKKNPAGVPSTFNDWNSHPEEWAKFVAYCKQDVTAEREILKKLEARWQWPESEHKVWVLDQKINSRGIPINLKFAEKALALIETERAAILYNMQMLTGCENPNSPEQLKEWLATQGYPFESADKECVAAALKLDTITQKCRELLQLKQLLGGIAFKKIPVIQQWTREDRLRYAFLYHSAHTGRWASKGVQFHNLLKPTKRVAENYDAIVAAIMGEATWPKDIPVVEGIAGSLRACVWTKEPTRLFVADFSSIENRVLAWLADCPGMLEVFMKGLDPYKSFASRMYNIPYDMVTKEQRNFCKSPVLGCGFGMGGPRLVGYAAQMGQTITEEQAVSLVKAWRQMYPEVVEYWDDLGRACMRAVVKEQYLQFGPIRLDGRDPEMFHIELPSGRTLNYSSPKIEKDLYHRDVLTHMSDDGFWKRVQARGSSLVENVVQAIARDLLVNGMFNLEAAGFTIVLHVHDELVAEVPYDSPLTYAQFEHTMIQNPKWALDLPIKAEGFEGRYYKK
jgi:DNA polymerase bacteriophage-type